MPEKRLASRDAAVDLPSHPQVRGRVARAARDDLATTWLGMRFRADDARDEGDMATAAEALLALGVSLGAHRGARASIMALDEALEAARAAGDATLVGRVTEALDRAMAATQA